jgi:integrase
MAMGRPRKGYHLKRDRGERSYLIIEGCAERITFNTRNPTKAEIADALALLRSNAKIADPVPPPPERDSLRALADAYYKSKQYLSDIGEVTRIARRNVIEALLLTLTPHGRKPRGQGKVYEVTRKHVIEIRDECLDKPETANARVKVLRYLYAFALDVEWPGVIANPAREVKLLPPKVKLSAEGEPYTGHQEWPLAKVEKFLDFYRDELTPYTTVSLMRFCGVRVSDAFTMGRAMERTIDWRGQQIRCLKFKITKGKSKRVREGKKAVEAIVPIVPEFAAVLDRLPPDQLMYVHSEHGRPYKSAKSLGNRMRKWCDAIVDEDGTSAFDSLSSHGLRKAAADWWVKHYRCTTHELMAIFGWLTEKEALHYTQGYDREDAAAGVVLKFPARKGA